MAPASKPRIVQIGPLSGSPVAQPLIDAHFEPFRLWEEADPIAALQREASSITAIVTTANYGCTRQIIEAMPALKAICSWGVGYDSIDIAAAREHGVLVSNTPDVLTDCVADTAWGLMIAASRRIAQGDRFVREGRWGQVHGSFPLGNRVSGKKLGILGLGRIGEAIARRGQGFDMEIRYHNRHARNDVPWTYADSLTALAAWADFLVIATVGGAGTHHLVNAPVLEALGPDGILVNISRGSVIDETALIQTLQQGKLRSAGLDVFEHEPQVPDALRTLDNVVLLPHIASATHETRAAMAELVLHNLQAFFETGKVLTPV